MTVTQTRLNAGLNLKAVILAKKKLRGREREAEGERKEGKAIKRAGQREE